VALSGPRVPPLTLMSAAVKPTGASVKVKVTCDCGSATLSAASTMSTATAGVDRSTV